VPSWRRGEAIALRTVCQGRVKEILPVTVAGDADGLLSLYVAEGTEWLGPFIAPGRTREVGVATEIAHLQGAAWSHAPRVWRETNTLMLLREGLFHAVWLQWEASSWTFRQWYVNFQRPYVRTAVGVDTLDLLVDLIVTPDLTTRWKDADQLAAGVDAGVISELEQERIEAEGRVIVAAARNGTPPDVADWRAWRPDCSWPIPAMQRDWLD
jgi:Protein of unknown function (DUF402)